MPEFIGEDVIGDQAPVVPQLAGGQRGQDGVEVAGDRAFADLDQQAEGSPGAALLRRRGLMVGADAHGHVGHQVPPSQGRGMPIHNAISVQSRPKFLQDPGVAGQDRRDVHHLGQPQDPWPGQ